MDKAKLSEFDTIVLVDRSGSMNGTAKGFPTRWAQAAELTTGIAGIAATVDEDGITVIQFGGSFNPSKDVQDNVKDASGVGSLFASHTPYGGTPLAQALEAAFKKKFDAGKKAIVFVVTDGVPDDAEAVKKAIVAASKKLTDSSELRVQFIQVGDDASATKYLEGLDNDLADAQFDIVNVIGYEDANKLSPGELYDRAITDSH